MYGYIIVLGIQLGHITSQIIDRGSLEIYGPRGIQSSLYSFSDVFVTLDTGRVTTYASYILLSTLSITFVCLI